MEPLVPLKAAESVNIMRETSPGSILAAGDLLASLPGACGKPVLPVLVCLGFFRGVRFWPHMFSCR